MTSSTISPLRRVAAVAAIAGVTGLGAVALAPSALADPMKPTTTPYTTVTGYDGQQWVVSPMPDKKIDAKIGKYHVKLYGWAAQAYQSLEATGITAGNRRRGTTVLAQPGTNDSQLMTASGLPGSV